MSALKVYVPRDAAALAKGANAVAAAIVAEAAARGVEVQVVRNGSRGLLWLETFVEVATNAGRVAYGPVKAADVAGLFEAGVFSASAAAASAAEGGHALCHGLTEAIPYFAKQQRLTFARVGITDPVCLEDYEAHGGLEARLGLGLLLIVPWIFLFVASTYESYKTRVSSVLQSPSFIVFISLINSNPNNIISLTTTL